MKDQMKTTKKRLMELAGLAEERVLSQYAIMVGSYPARLMGFEVTITSGKTMDGGNISGDFLVVGYGRIIQNVSGDFDHDTRPANSIIFVQGGGGKTQGVIYHPKMDGDTIKIKDKSNS